VSEVRKDITAPPVGEPKVEPKAAGKPGPEPKAAEQAAVAKPPEELIIGTWEGKHWSRKLSGEIDQWDETYDFDRAGTFRRICKLPGLSASTEGEYKVVDDKTLATWGKDSTKQTRWKMTLTGDILLLEHPEPDRKVALAGRSKLTRRTGPVSPGSAAARSEDLEKLQGTWKMKSVKWAEQDKTTMILLTSRWEITVKGNEVTEVTENGGKEERRRYSIALDEKKTPKVYTMTSLEGKDKGKASSGIYSLDGDTLRMCSQREGLPRDFTITQGQDVNSKYLHTYQRVKR
jgi:uncharacterized protein (TIGR03067 family)